MKKNLLLCFMMFAFTISESWAQTRTVTGKVTGADDGASLPGVNVLIKGTSTGTITDTDGAFSLSADDGTILVFSFIGYTNYETTVGNRSVIDIQMATDVQQLSEVVVTAFGLERDKKQLGYSAQEVDNAQLVKSAETNIVNAMNGKIAGVQITGGSGAPGASANILIRGGSSISGNNQPLFVIDGIPIDNSTDASNASGGVTGTSFQDYGDVIGTNRASDLNPADIESVTVLKGGAATALYGLRAVNGAIIVTTKSGKGGDNGLNVDFTTSYSKETPNKYPEFQEAHARGRNGSYSNVTHWSWGAPYAGNPVFPAGTTLDNNGDGIETDVSGQAIPLYRNNYKNFWDDGSTQTTNVSVYGNGENSNFYTSFGYTDQQGIVPTSGYKKYNFTMKASTDVSDKLTIGAYAGYNNTRRIAHQGANTGFGQGLAYWHNQWDISDNRPWKTETGDRTWFSDFVGDPRWLANEEAETSNVDRIIGNANFSYQFTDWLKFQYRIGVDTYSDQRDLMRPITSPNTTNRAGDIYEVRIDSRDITSNFMLSGKFDLNDDMSLGYLVGHDIYDSRYDRVWAYGEGLSIQGFYDISNAATTQVTNTINRKRIMGTFGELSFSWKDALFLNVTGRNDKSSTLPEVNNNFFYPSVSLGYVFTETLGGSLGPINRGRIKGSWAQIGNDAPIYATQSTYAKDQSLTGGVNVNGSAGPPRFSISSVQGSETLEPELSTAIEGGIELQAFDNMFGLDLTLYQRNTEKQVLFVPLSSSTGYGSRALNAGEIRNSGVEMVLSYNNVLKSVTDKLNWSGYVNFTKNKNEVISVPDGLDEIVVGYSYWNAATIVARPGLPLGSYVGPGYKRNDAGTMLLDDSGYPQLADENLVLGNPNPDWTMGINNSFSYKGFRLDATLDIRQGGEILNDAEAFWVYSGLSKTTEDRYYAGANPGDAPDPNANATRVFDGIIESTGQASTIAAPLDNTYFHNLNAFVDEAHIEDASWVRLRTLSLTYSLPSNILGSFFKAVDITFTGRNLWLKTDYSGVDPEMNAFGAGNIQGIDLISAPNTKSYGGSIRIKF